MTEELCPKCGAVLTGFIITTIPPIHGVSCPSCGWRHEEQQQITRSVYQERKPQTWGDKVRAMSDEELAVLCEDGCPPNHECPPSEEEEIGLRSCCQKCWLDWLKEEVSE